METQTKRMILMCKDSVTPMKIETRRMQFIHKVRWKLCYIVVHTTQEVKRSTLELPSCWKFFDATCIVKSSNRGRMHVVDKL